MVEASLVNLAELGVLIVGVVIALQQLNDLKHTREMELETRQAQLFSVLIERMDNVEWWRHYLNIRDLPGKTYDEVEEIIREDPDVYGGFMSILAFLNHVGWLVRKGLIDIQVIRETLRIVVIRVHENTRPILDEYEKRTGTSQRYIHLEYLYDALKESYYQDLHNYREHVLNI